jgi:nucleotide-binding universal stress UspA family protein
MKILIFASSKTNSKSAVMFGGLIAGHMRASVTLLTVINDHQDLDTAHQVLDQAGWWIPHLDVRTSIRVGNETTSILDEIDSSNYDLIVLKARQVVQLKDHLKSKVGHQVARQAPISVLVVKRKQPDLKRILLCTSGVDIADPVIEMGTHLAQATQAKVTLLHVADSIPTMYTGLDKIEEHLPEILQTDTPMAQHLRHAIKLFAKNKVDAELELRHGSVSDEILIEARTGDYDLIILGASKASTNLTGWLMGDITDQIVKAARCPVLVVRKSKS